MSGEYPGQPAPHRLRSRWLRRCLCTRRRSRRHRRSDSAFLPSGDHVLTNDLSEFEAVVLGDPDGAVVVKCLRVIQLRPDIDEVRPGFNEAVWILFIGERPIQGSGKEPNARAETGIVLRQCLLALPPFLCVLLPGTTSATTLATEGLADQLAHVFSCEQKTWFGIESGSTHAPEARLRHRDAVCPDV